MKTLRYTFIGIALLLLVSCHNKSLEFDASGIFEATEVIVSAKGNGELKRFEVEEGQEVEAALPVGLIDTTQLYLKKMQLKAMMSGITHRKTDVSIQVAAIQQQIETQKKEQQRFANLVKMDAGNRKQLDDIEAQIHVLKKQLAAQFESINNSNNSLNDEYLSLQMQIAQLDDQIDNSQISSPIRGTVLAKYAEPGEFTAQGRPLFKVADISSMYLRAYVTASQLTTLKIGQSVSVYADSGESGKKEYAGRVTWISDKAEFTPKTIQTRDERANLVYAVKIAVANDGFIKKGMYGEVQF